MPQKKMVQEKCSYVRISEDSEVEEVNEDEVDVEYDAVIFLKIVRLGNGKVTLHNLSKDNEKVLEI
jgi:hypothetical protein